jgi:hypothetical protein
MITTGLTRDYMDLTAGCYNPSPFKEILPQDLEQRGWCKRGYTRITTEGETLDTWNEENPLSPM